MSQRISREQFEQRLAELCVDSGSMEFPHRDSDRHILWESILVGLEPAVHYSEKAIDEHIQHWLTTIGRTINRDHVNIRRQLVDVGYLIRTQDGSVYQHAATGPSRERFDVDVENVNCDAVIQKRQALRAQKRQDFFKKHFQQEE